jgi:hypothetical protein
MVTNTKKRIPNITKDKVISIRILYGISLLIIFFGATFSIHCFSQHISYTIMSYPISGGIFGIIVVFLGIRYFFSTRKLRDSVYQQSSSFSWGNFRMKK